MQHQFVFFAIVLLYSVRASFRVTPSSSSSDISTDIEKRLRRLGYFFATGDSDDDEGGVRSGIQQRNHNDLVEIERITTMLFESLDSNNANQPKTFLITGATSGIGLEAAKMLALLNPLNRLILVGRNEEKARMAAQEVASILPRRQPQYYEHHIIPMVCDHSSFASVQQFARQLQQKLDETYNPQILGPVNCIDVVCLNAATLRPKDVPAQFTEDDLEITFQTNHLSPFLLINLIHKFIKPNSGRVIVTTSGLYVSQTLNLTGIPVDEKTGRAIRNKRFVTANGVQYYCKHSYAFSKLCNVVMAMELQNRLQHLGITVSTFSPGLITQTGLFRHHRDDLPFKPTEALMRNEKTILWGAGALVFMATSRKVTQVGGGTYWHDLESGKGPNAVYGVDFGPTQVSEDHITEQGRKELWSLSCDLTGISSQNVIPSSGEFLAEISSSSSYSSLSSATSDKIMSFQTSRFN